MNTWLDHWDRRYTDRVRLLVEILPVLAQRWPTVYWRPLLPDTTAKNQSRLARRI